MVMMQWMQMMRHNTKVVSTGASLNVVAQLKSCKKLLVEQTKNSHLYIDC